jgi:hypothetical protein
MTAALLCLALAAGAGDEARAELSRAAVALGEPFEVAVALRHEPGEQVEVEPMGDLGAFGLRASRCRTTAGERAALTACTLVFQLFELGEHQLPSVPLRVRAPGGLRRLSAAAGTVRGLPTLDPDQPAAALELREPPAPPVWVRSWRPVTAAAGALAALALAVLLWRRLRRPAAPEPAHVLEPHRRLAQRLKEIAGRDLVRRGRGREHVDLVAEAVRAFLAAVAPQAPLDQTTTELLAVLADRPAPGVDGEALGRFLEEADLVKFARLEPDPQACERALRFARDLAEAPLPPREAAA